MPKGVTCFVEECVFNADDRCLADAIEVRSNGNDIVGTSKGTMCRTFRYRDFDDGHADADLAAHP
ncbi:DUF1540 domain-containing protein [Alicyclobacillus kakegawensis]|uniref:DUF1540 domain-containing protein n=1 Tax=Alicyclobacillus kakegawensis TaxID=392012 RepID=UPI00082F1FDB|nr:DUF1540 domain-containing protein [Alicyclobacillus kakegawensis]